MGTIDLHCERGGPDFWAEPVNALTNGAFFVTAWAIWRLARRTGTLSPGIRLLIATSVAIGVGSVLFHTLAIGWAERLDVGPVLVFQLLFLWLYLRRVAGVGRPAAGLPLAAFFAASDVSRRFPMALNGSLMYAPAFVTVLALASYHAATVTRGRFDLLLVAAGLAVALAFRTLDNAICGGVPIGSHFLWHLTNGAVFYLAARTLIRQQPDRNARAASP